MSIYKNPSPSEIKEIIKDINNNNTYGIKFIANSKRKEVFIWAAKEEHATMFDFLEKNHGMNYLEYSGANEYVFIGGATLNGFNFIVDDSFTSEQNLDDNNWVSEFFDYQDWSFLKRYRLQYENYFNYLKNKVKK